jgi:hypothetical protein
MIEKSTHEEHKLKNIIARIKQEAISFIKVSYYHIMRELNQEVDQWAKQATNINPVILLKNGGHEPLMIP